LVDGVIYLRGGVIPVVSLRRAFGLAGIPPDDRQVIDLAPLTANL
jgi:chemotaxis signal transduction protein